MATIEGVRAAYEEGRGRWSGCNWPTHYGRLCLDLDGVSSRQARQAADRWLAIAADVATREATACEEAALADMAVRLRLGRTSACGAEDRYARRPTPGGLARRLCAEALAREWKVAAYVLAEIEWDARRAEQEARAAVRAAEGGDWEHALWRARRACLIESGYHAPRPWRRLKRVIERLAT